MQNGIATLEESLAVSYKTLTRQSSNFITWYLDKRVENLCLHENIMFIFLFLIAQV
jgi:hypothetical protein